MKRYVLALALMVLCAAALIVAVAYYRPAADGLPPRRERGPRPPEKSFEEIAEKVGPAVVAINTTERKVIRPRMRDPLFQPVSYTHLTLPTTERV